MRRVAFAELQARIELVLLALGVAPARAALGARLTAETDRDGVRTHGVARLPRFAQWVRNGLIDPRAGPDSQPLDPFGRHDRVEPAVHAPAYLQDIGDAQPRPQWRVLCDEPDAGPECRPMRSSLGGCQPRWVAPTHPTTSLWHQ